MTKRITFLLAGILAAVLIAAPTAVFAHNGDDDTATSPDTSVTHTTADNTRSRGSDDKNTTLEHSGKTEDSATHTGNDSTASANGEHRLLDAKLRVCRARAKNITGIMNGSVARSEKQAELFATITERTEAFYQKQGKTAANYDELVAAVDSAKATVATDITAAKTAIGDGFDCDGSNPKGTASTVKQDIEKTRTDMKAYKQAVKNLIVAVKAAQGDQ
jgi:hypothetical protein